MQVTNRDNNQVGPRRAAVYIRVSSEQQARKKAGSPDEADELKFSPQAQEADCRAHCEARGYAVVAVYADVEKYRVGRRLVEPSGSRADRPQLRRMLADARAGRFDVIVAWREDRLYRSYRPMLDVLECLDEARIAIELVKEHFDPQVAPVKAWAARIELQAKRDRFMMGVAGRLAKGKTWNNQATYGYKSVDGYPVVAPEEAEWILKVKTWYAEGAGLQVIRKRLIAGNAPQRRPTRFPWGIGIVQTIVYRDYHAGTLVYRWDGETYTIQLPSITSAELEARVLERRKQSGARRLRNLKHEYLAAGVVYCAGCKIRAGMITLTHYANGELRKTPVRTSRCTYYPLSQHTPDCFRRMGLKKLEQIIWDKVWSIVSDDQVFEQLVEDRYRFLAAQEADASAEVERINREKANLSLERQRVITYARKDLITEADLQVQLGALSFQEAELNRALAEQLMLTGNRAARLMELANRIRAELREGGDVLNARLKDPDDVKRQVGLRRKVLDAIVSRIDIHRDHTITVHFEFDLTGAMAGEVYLNDPQACTR